MPTVANDRIAFLHVPKTGGTWATRALKAAGVELEELFTENPEARGHGELEVVPEGLFTIAFVREPLSWYASYWRHRQMYRDRSGGTIDDFVRSSYMNFLVSVAVHERNYLGALYERFCGPLEQPIEFIGRYESLVDDLAEALRIAGQDFDEDVLRGFPKQNTTTGGPPTIAPRSVELALLAAEGPCVSRFYPELRERESGSTVDLREVRRLNWLPVPA